MLTGDIPVDNDHPMNLNESKGTWVQEGPHLMILLPPKRSLAIYPETLTRVVHTSCGKAVILLTLWSHWRKPLQFFMNRITAAAIASNVGRNLG